MVHHYRLFLNYRSMRKGEIGGGRFAQRTYGVGASILTGSTIGGPWGAVGGAAVGGAVWAGEEVYDGINWWIGEMSRGLVGMENALKGGWQPQIQI